MISEVGSIITSDLMDVLRSEGLHDADAEEEGSVEDRVIAASLKMIRKGKKKSAELAEQLMLFYAVRYIGSEISIFISETAPLIHRLANQNLIFICLNRLQS